MRAAPGPRGPSSGVHSMPAPWRRKYRLAGPPSSSLPRKAFTVTSAQSMRRIDPLAFTCTVTPDGLVSWSGCDAFTLALNVPQRARGSNVATNDPTRRCARRSGREIEKCFTALQIERHRNLIVHDEPVAIDLAQARRPSYPVRAAAPAA